MRASLFETERIRAGLNEFGRVRVGLFLHIQVSLIDL